MTALAAETAALPTTSAGPGLAAILDRLWRRRIIALPVHEWAREMSDHYNGRIVVPLPEIDAEERPAAANLIAQNLDQHAMRVASVQPAKMVAPLAATRTAEKIARSQLRVLNRFDQVNQMNLFDRRRARWLATWACAPSFLRPDPATRSPLWELRSPLGSYPAPTARWDDMRPTDTINTYLQTWGWLQENQPQAAAKLAAARQGGLKPWPVDSLFEMVEFQDCEVTVLAAMSSVPAPMLGLLNDWGMQAIQLPNNAKGQTFAVELLRTPNLAECVTAVIPNRITLDGPKGLADDMVGIYQMQAKMLALHVNAVANAIYPNTWFVEQPGNQGEIITQADGLRGIMGHVKGGTIEQMNMQPGVQTMGVINALERNQMASGSSTSEYSGESPTAVRTAQRGLDVAANAIGFYIQEDQEVLARAKQHEYEIAAAIDKGYFAKDKKSFYVSFGKERGHVDYTPGQLWETIPEIDVRYFYAGMDIAGVTQLVGQQLGEGTISRETAMRQNPYVYDVDAERGRVIADHLEDALLSSVQQQGATGAIAPTDLARISELCASGDFTLAEAVTKAQQEAQARQASTTGTATPGAPEAQIGLQAGPQGAAQPTVSGPNQSQVNLKALVGALAAGH